MGLSLSDWAKRADWTPQLILRVEPAYALHRIIGDWNLEGGTNYTYWVDHSELGKPNNVIFCSASDGSISAWTEVGSKGAVESTNDSWFYETSSGKLYFHADINSWSDYLASFSWVYFTNTNPENNLLVIDDKPVRELLHDASLPDISQSISDFYLGSLQLDLGTVSLNADPSLDEWWWKYIWVRKRMDALLGGVGGTYPDDFTTIWNGWTGKLVWSEEEVRIDVTDLREVTPFV